MQRSKFVTREFPHLSFCGASLYAAVQALQIKGGAVERGEVAMRYDTVARKLLLGVYGVGTFQGVRKISVTTAIPAIEEKNTPSNAIFWGRVVTLKSLVQASAMTQMYRHPHRAHMYTDAVGNLTFGGDNPKGKLTASTDTWQPLPEMTMPAFYKEYVVNDFSAKEIATANSISIKCFSDVYGSHVSYNWNNAWRITPSAYSEPFQISLPTNVFSHVLANCNLRLVGYDRNDQHGVTSIQSYCLHRGIHFQIKVDCFDKRG